jgi:DNA-binding transcriptional LysR family regulator
MESGERMTLVQFQVFLSVVECKSFTKAAEALNMTQSAVSQTIAGLESELGVTLLNRSRGGITPTHIGERALTHVREVLYRTRCMVEETSAARGLEIGALRIGSMPSLSAKLLPGILASFGKRFPHIKLVLFEGTSEEVTHWVDASIIDIGFLTMNDCTGMTTFPLVEDEFSVFLPSEHPLVSEPFLTVSQVAPLPFIMPKADSDGFIHEVFESVGHSPNVQFEVRDTATILSMVQEGIGITMLPEMAVPSLLPNVQSISLNPPIARPVGLGVRSTQYLTPAVAEFILHAQDYVQKSPGSKSIVKQSPLLNSVVTL